MLYVLQVTQGRGNFCEKKSAHEPRLPWVRTDGVQQNYFGIDTFFIGLVHTLGKISVFEFSGFAETNFTL